MLPTLRLVCVGTGLLSSLPLTDLDRWDGHFLSHPCALPFLLDVYQWCFRKLDGQQDLALVSHIGYTYAYKFTYQYDL